jgi:hypothetical protein
MKRVKKDGDPYKVPPNLDQKLSETLDQVFQDYFYERFEEEAVSSLSVIFDHNEKGELILRLWASHADYSINLSELAAEEIKTVEKDVIDGEAETRRKLLMGLIV